MGYPLQNGAPKIQGTDGSQYAVGAFLFPNPMGSFYQVGVFKNVPMNGSDSWNSTWYVINSCNPGDLIALVQAKGGIVNCIEWIIEEINKIFVKLFPGNVALPPGTEPKTDDEAMAMITEAINKMTLTMVNGVPVLSK